MRKKGKKVDRVQNQVQKAASSVEDEEALIAKAIEESKAAFVSIFLHPNTNILGIRAKDSQDEGRAAQR